MINLTLVQFAYHPSCVPLGALYLAYGLEKATIKFDLKIFPIFEKAAGSIEDRLYSFLVNTQKIIAIGCWADMLPFVLVTLEKIKLKFPEKIIILGGVGPTRAAEEILNNFKFVDYIIKGCGVHSLPKLIKKVMDGDTALSDIEGLVFRSSGHVTSSYYSGYHLNIPDLPSYQRLENIQSYSFFTIFTSFGCPYQCTFCSIRIIFPKKITYRDINQVIDEIKVIKKIKKSKPFIIDIADEGFIVDRERVVKFCNMLISQRLHIKWYCYGRIDRMDEELLRTMSKSGCSSIFYGVESGSNIILNKIKKGFTVEEAIKILILTRKYIKGVTASFIYLYPFEGMRSFRETVFIAKYLKRKKILVEFRHLIPAKDSDIYFKYKKRLFFEEGQNSLSCLGTNRITGKCAKLIKNNPKIFYFYYLYNSPEFNKIQKMAEQLQIPVVQ